MAPPKFDDLGKASRDLFSKGYSPGFLKFDTKAKATSDIELKTASSHNLATGKFFGSVDFRYKFRDYGIILSEKWNTDNTLGAEIAIEDELAKGLKFTFDTTTTLNLGKRSGKFKIDYKHDQFYSDLLADVASKLITFSTVVKHKNWLLGAQVSSDWNLQKLQRHTLAFGYDQDRFGMHAYLSDSQEVGAHLYHQVNSQVELGATLGWSQKDQSTRFGVATMYQVDSSTQFRAKLNSSSQMGIAMQHTLKPGLKLIISSLLNLATPNEAGAHKFGIGLEYEP